MSVLETVGTARAVQQKRYYHGTIGAVEGASPLTAGVAAHAVAGVQRDVDRSPGADLRASAVWAAASVREATTIAAIRSYSRSAPIPHAAIHVYRVELIPFHLGPLAVMEELQRRFATAARACIEALVREYWQPTGTWHVREFLAPALTLLEEVPAASERDIYLLRWVRYNEDLERAQSI